ncbi:MAG: protein translocase subunit SecD [Acidobacteria bacterium]|nr:protein translocase subunit SecD [Acidobacteriota bacterium]
MAAKNGILKSARRSLLWLVILTLGIPLLIGANMLGGDKKTTFVPNLALDLSGGTQIILTPVVKEGQQVLPEQLNQAVGIIRQRVDSTGVSEAQINTSGNNIVVSIPGTPDKNTLALIKSSAKLEFRAVLAASAGTKTQLGAKGSTPIKTSTAKPTDASDLNWVSAALQKEYENLDCSKTFREPGQVDPEDLPLVTCAREGYEKYILGPVELTGLSLEDAAAGTVTGANGSATNEWAVNLDFNADGGKKFGDITSRLYPLTDPRNRFAVTVDGYVITAPTTQAVITGGQAQITGNYDQKSAQLLADQLKYGALPISFTVQSQENISATLGTEQLQAGLLAGLIGLLLVVGYSIFQYRALAVLTLGSLTIAAVLTYLAIALLTWRQDYRLSLSGIAGLIVAIGITADSFIVYFERVRDELREGKSLPVAVEAGWARAKRTIIVSDSVSLLAAATLFVLTVGNVKGFAFTLGLTTIIDLAVVWLFTHPMFQVLAQTKFFASGSKFSGLEIREAAAFGYTGRGTFRVSETVSKSKAASASKEAEKRQTIAERKAQLQGEVTKISEDN